MTTLTVLHDLTLVCSSRTGLSYASDIQGPFTFRLEEEMMDQITIQENKVQLDELRRSPTSG